MSLTDLRSFEMISHNVEKHLSKMGLKKDEVSSDWDELSSSESDLEDLPKQHTSATQGKGLKSGKTAKVMSRIENPQFWPQSELICFVCKDVLFNALKLGRLSIYTSICIALSFKVSFSKNVILFNMLI
jgi:hypothetical protein